MTDFDSKQEVRRCFCSFPKLDADVTRIWLPALGSSSADPLQVLQKILFLPRRPGRTVMFGQESMLLQWLFLRNSGRRHHHQVSSPLQRLEMMERAVYQIYFWKNILTDQVSVQLESQFNQFAPVAVSARCYGCGSAATGRPWTSGFWCASERSLIRGVKKKKTPLKDAQTLDINDAGGGTQEKAPFCPSCCAALVLLVWSTLTPHTPHPTPPRQLCVCSIQQKCWF